MNRAFRRNGSGYDMAHILIVSGNVVPGIRGAIDEGSQSQDQWQSCTHAQHCFVVFGFESLYMYIRAPRLAVH